MDGAQQTEKSMPTGEIKWFDTSKGYGFIAPDDKTQYVFVQRKVVSSGEDPQKGDKVRYEAEETLEGPKATSVHPAT